MKLLYCSDKNSWWCDIAFYVLLVNWENDYQCIIKWHRHTSLWQKTASCSITVLMKFQVNSDLFTVKLSIIKPVMVTSSPSFKNVLVFPPPRSMLLDPLHDSSSMEPKRSWFCGDTQVMLTDRSGSVGLQGRRVKCEGQSEGNKRKVLFRNRLNVLTSWASFR